MTDYRETLHDNLGQFFAVEKMLHEVRTEHQHLVIFQNPRMGRVMALDGAIKPRKPMSFHLS